MAVLFEYQPISGFEPDFTGFYCGTISGTAPFAPEVDQTYRVVWEDVEYICTAFGFDGPYGYCIGIGNKAITDGVTFTTEPFGICYLTTNAWMGVYSIDTEESHRIGISIDDASLPGTTLFHYQPIEGFELDDTGFYCQAIGSPPPFILEANKTYIVKWDGVEYTCTAFAFTSVVGDCIGIGNTIIKGDGSWTDEPFNIFYNIDWNLMGAYSIDTNAIHTVGVYLPGIVIRNHRGEAVTYGDYKKIRLNKSNGSKVIYSEGEAIEKSLNQDEINFSKGVLEIAPNSGELFSKVSIPVPNGLSPENIAKGVNIAGVDGEHIGGGEGGAITHYENTSASIINSCQYVGLGFISVKFTNVKRVETNAFNYCKELKKADFDNVEFIGSGAFYNGFTPYIEHIIIRTSTKCALDSNNPALLYGLGASDTVSIYVPRSLLSSYKSDANWSIFEANFKAIEDYANICG